MGNRVIITKASGEYEIDAVGDCVHGTETQCGDAATVCGIYFVDGVEEYKNTNKPISCTACVNALENRGVFSKRNNNWY